MPPPHFEHQSNAHTSSTVIPEPQHHQCSKTRPEQIKTYAHTIPQTTATQTPTSTLHKPTALPATPPFEVGVAVAVYTPVGTTVAVPVPNIELDWGNGMPGFPAVTLDAGGVYWLGFSYQTPFMTIPLPASMSDIWSEVHVLWMART